MPGNGNAAVGDHLDEVVGGLEVVQLEVGGAAGVGEVRVAGGDGDDLVAVAAAHGDGLVAGGDVAVSAEDYAAWMRNLRVVADSVQRWSGFRDVRVELVREDAPAGVRAEAIRRLRELISLQAQVTGDSVVVVPILVSRGGISRSRIMKDLEGLPARYADTSILPHPAIAEWVSRRVRTAITDR